MNFRVISVKYTRKDPTCRSKMEFALRAKLNDEWTNESDYNVSDFF